MRKKRLARLPQISVRSKFTSIVDLAGRSINGLEELVDFLVGHLFTEVGEDYVQVSIAYPSLLAVIRCKSHCSAAGQRQ